MTQLVEVVRDSEDTWGKIARLVQPLASLYDNYGNLRDCAFGRVQKPGVGEVYEFRALDPRVAEEVRDALAQDRSLRILNYRQ